MQFIIYPKKMKYLGTNVTELAQDVSGENYQITGEIFSFALLMKEFQ